MTTGLGFSIGSVNSVSAMVAGERPWSSVRTRRTAVTFDSAGSIRIGGIPQFDMAVTDFADLARDPEPVVVGGRLWSPANLVAAVVNGLLEAAPSSAAGAVCTYPASYSDKQVALLRQAMNLAGAADVLLIPEPIAAAEWLEQERGPLEPGFVLVYDLGGTSLDVSIVRVGSDWEDHPIVGQSLRCYDFGGRPLGSMIARYAGGSAVTRSSAQSLTSIVDVDGLRTEHIRDSFEIIRTCLRTASLSLSDISRILLIGGATRPMEVARTLAELGRPVLMSADPGQTVAVGAASFAARTFAPAISGGRHRAPRVAVFSSAAVASAVAMSAMTAFGGPAQPAMSPMLDQFPGAVLPSDILLYEPNVGAPVPATSGPISWSGQARGVTVAGRPVSGVVVATVAKTTQIGPTLAESRRGSHDESHRCCGGGTRSGGSYSNPAYFINPLPFPSLPHGAAPAIGRPGAGPAIPSVSLPSPIAATDPAPAPAPAPAPDLGTSAPTSPDNGTMGGTVGGTTSGGVSSGAANAGGGGTGETSGGSTSGGDATGGSTPNGSTSGESSSGGSTSGGSTGGSTSGGSVSGGSTSGGSGSGGSSSGGSSSGGSSSGGSGSGGSGGSGGGGR